MTNEHPFSAAAINEAFVKSAFSVLSPTQRNTLTHDGIHVDLPAGTTLYYE
jgi:hypothetical protein